MRATAIIFSALQMMREASIPIIIAYSCGIGTKYKLRPMAEPMKLDFARSMAIFLDSFSCGDITRIIEISVHETEYSGKDTNRM
ncbi:hypothetical protein D3C72_1898510 [compost metagenome]